MRIHEECGVFGAYDRDGGDVAPLVYLGLTALQHRGQESCGIAVSDTRGPRDALYRHRDLGLVSEVLQEAAGGTVRGNLAVGHVRYSTTGASTRDNAQPLTLNYIKGTMALAHNGNLVNTEELRRELAYGGAIFQTTTDSEVIAYLIARERVRCGSIEEAVKHTVKKLAGGFSLVIKSPRKLIAVRDPLGLKPLCFGKRNNCYMAASESCAIEAAGGELIRDIRPGEILTITEDDLMSDTDLCRGEHARCVFESIYFARLDSCLDGISVLEARMHAGRILARESPADADLVTGVPDSGLAAAEGFAEESGIPFSLAFHKNSYVGRTFIRPTQAERIQGVKMKLSVLKPAVLGKRIVLTDDSIVRGTTMANLISMLRDAGAKEVHVRISAPPFLHPCYYGTDVPTQGELIASSHSEEEIRKLIGADSLAFLNARHLPEMAGSSGICAACFTGVYPAGVPAGAEEVRSGR